MQITDIPSWLAGAWSISEAVAQVILSLTVLLAVMLPVFLATRGRNAVTVHLFFFFLTECFLAGVGWMPFWILIATVCVMALAAASVGTKAVTGG